MTATPDAVKERAVAEYAAGESTVAVAARIDVTPQTVVKWARAAGVFRGSHGPQYYKQTCPRGHAFTTTSRRGKTRRVCRRCDQDYKMRLKYRDAGLPPVLTDHCECCRNRPAKGPFCRLCSPLVKRVGLSRASYVFGLLYDREWLAGEYQRKAAMWIADDLGVSGRVVARRLKEEGIPLISTGERNATNASTGSSKFGRSPNRQMVTGVPGRKPGGIIEVSS